MKNKILVLTLSFIFALCSSLSVYGQLGQNLTIANAKALSLANAVTADPPGPDSLHFNPAGLYRAIEMTAHGEHDAKRMLLNMITTSLYLGLPLLWSGMMAWAGVQVGRSINNATSPLARPGEDAGRQGGAIGRAAVSRGLRR